MNGCRTRKVAEVIKFTLCSQGSSGSLMTPDDRDRRRFERLTVDLRVRVFASIAGKSRLSYGRAHDLGEGGLALYVPLELKVGQEVRLEIEIPNARFKFGIRGLVRSADGYRYGIEFRDLSRKELEELKRSLHLIALTASIQKPAQ